MVNARVLKTLGPKGLYKFDSCSRYKINKKNKIMCWKSKKLKIKTAKKDISVWKVVHANKDIC